MHLGPAAPSSDTDGGPASVPRALVVSAPGQPRGPAWRRFQARLPLPRASLVKAVGRKGERSPGFGRTPLVAGSRLGEPLVAGSRLGEPWAVLPGAPSTPGTGRPGAHCCRGPPHLPAAPHSSSPRGRGQAPADAPLKVSHTQVQENSLLGGMLASSVSCRSLEGQFSTLCPGILTTGDA